MLLKRLIRFCLFFALSFGSNEACSCLPKHPQTMFCEAEFVALMTPLNVTNIDRDRLQFGVQWNRFYKPIRPLQGPTFGSIITSDNPGLCGVQFSIGTPYVVSGTINGGVATVYLCNFISVFAFLTPFQRTALESTYASGCVCSICDNEFNECGDLRTSCLSNLTSTTCYDAQAACLIDCRGRCRWTASNDLRTCLGVPP